MISRHAVAMWVLALAVLASWAYGQGQVLEVPGQYATIQAAVTAAQDGDTVRVAAGRYYESVFCSYKSISLVGSGSDTCLIDASAGAGQPALRITVGSVNVSGFTFTGTTPGPAAEAGAVTVRYEVSAVFDDCRIVDNTAGTGLRVYTGGSVTYRNGLIARNVNGTDGASSGGVTLYGGHLTLEDTDITNNSSVYCGGGVTVHAWAPATLTIRGTAGRPRPQVSHNHALSSGGGIYVVSERSPASIDISGIDIHHNSLMGTYPHRNGGGGLAVAQGYGHAMTGRVHDCDIYANTSDVTSGPGGGVLLSSASIELSECDIRDNTCLLQGSGVMVVEGLSAGGPGVAGPNTIKNNQIRNNFGGPGLYITNAFPLVKGNIISGNVCPIGNYAHGAGIFAESNNSGGGSTLTILNNTIVGNRAAPTYGYGGGVYLALLNTLPERIVFAGNLVAGNTAEMAGGVNVENQTLGNTIELINNTIACNTDVRNYGLRVSLRADQTSTVRVLNTVVWGPSPTNMLYCGSRVTVSNCYVGSSYSALDSTNVIDPLTNPFTGIGARPYELADLRAIDGGTRALLPPDLTEDLLGNPRIFGAAVDMGCYEMGSTWNRPPVAVALLNGADPTGPVTLDENAINAAVVTLDGSTSSDPDTGDSIASYHWDVTGGTLEPGYGAGDALVKVRYPIGGPYTATLTVTDTKGVSASDTLQLTVQAISPAEELTIVTEMIADGVAAGTIDPAIEQGLLAKVNSALDALERGNANDAKVAINNLTAFVNQVNAQTDKKIEAETAADLIAWAEQVIAELTESAALNGPKGALITAASAVPTNAGAQITFTLSGAGRVDVIVLNLAGRTIRTVVAARNCEAGVNSLTWNACSDRGLRVPAGMYLVRLTSAAEDGSASQAIAPLCLKR